MTVIQQSPVSISISKYPAKRLYEPGSALDIEGLANRINRMVKTAGFRVLKTLDEFVWNSAIELPSGLTQDYMTDLHFLTPKEKQIFIGSVGTGNTHLTSPISLKACTAGRKRRLIIADGIINRLLERTHK